MVELSTRPDIPHAPDRASASVWEPQGALVRAGLLLLERYPFLYHDGNLTEHDFHAEEIARKKHVLFSRGELPKSLDVLLPRALFALAGWRGRRLNVRTIATRSSDNLGHWMPFAGVFLAAKLVGALEVGRPRGDASGCLVCLIPGVRPDPVWRQALGVSSG